MTPEFKRAGLCVYLLEPDYGADGLPTEQSLAEVFDLTYDLAASCAAESIYATGFGGIAEAVAKSCFGNMIGFAFADVISVDELTRKRPGAFVVALDRELEGRRLLGHTTEEKFIYCNGEQIGLDSLVCAWSAPLERVFPTRPKKERSLRCKNPPVFVCAERHTVLRPDKIRASARGYPCVPGYQLRIRQRARILGSGRRAGRARAAQPYAQSAGAVALRVGKSDRRGADTHVARRILGRRRAGRQRQIHHRGAAQPGDLRVGHAAARRPRRVDIGGSATVFRRWSKAVFCPADVSSPLWRRAVRR